MKHGDIESENNAYYEWCKQNNKEPKQATSLQEYLKEKGKSEK